MKKLYPDLLPGPLEPGDEMLMYAALRLVTCGLNCDTLLEQTGGYDLHEEEPYPYETLLEMYEQIVQEDPDNNTPYIELNEVGRINVYEMRLSHYRGLSFAGERQYPRVGITLRESCVLLANEWNAWVEEMNELKNGQRS